MDLFLGIASGQAEGNSVAVMVGAASRVYTEGTREAKYKATHHEQSADSTRRVREGYVAAP